MLLKTSFRKPAHAPLHPLPARDGTISCLRTNDALGPWNRPPGLYVQKTRQIVSSVRSTRGASAMGLQSPFAAQLKGAVGKHGANRQAGGLMDALNAKLGVSG